MTKAVVSLCLSFLGVFLVWLILSVFVLPLAAAVAAFWLGLQMVAGYKA